MPKDLLLLLGWQQCHLPWSSPRAWLWHHPTKQARVSGMAPTFLQDCLLLSTENELLETFLRRRPDCSSWPKTIIPEFSSQF
jgi:hypothetical protein